MYQVHLYEDARGYCPIERLINNLDNKAETNKDAKIQLKQITTHIGLLEKVGTWSKKKKTKHLRDNIWELRTGKNRILFFIWVENKIVLLHHFRKKSNKTPIKEIDRAKREAKDWINRHEQ